MFVGREYELSRLQEQYERNESSLVVIRGRRRVGKSRLISELASRYRKGGFRVFQVLRLIRG